MDEQDKLEEYGRQRDQLSDSLKYLKETNPTCLCLKAEGVLPVNQVWFTALNYPNVEVKSLVKDLQAITIKHLESELNKINKIYNTLLSRKMFNLIRD